MTRVGKSSWGQEKGKEKKNKLQFILHFFGFTARGFLSTKRPFFPFELWKIQSECLAKHLLLLKYLIICVFPLLNKILYIRQMVKCLPWIWTFNTMFFFAGLPKYRLFFYYPMHFFVIFLQYCYVYIKRIFFFYLN